MQVAPESAHTKLVNRETPSIKVKTPLDTHGNGMLRINTGCIQPIHINQTRDCCRKAWIFNFLVGSSNRPIKMDAFTLGTVSWKQTNTL